MMIKSGAFGKKIIVLSFNLLIFATAVFPQERVILLARNAERDIDVQCSPSPTGKKLTSVKDKEIVYRLEETGTVESGDLWFKVRLLDGRIGWISIDNAIPINILDEMKKYKKLYSEMLDPAVQGLKENRRDYFDYVNDGKIIAKLIPEAENKETRAGLELSELICIQRSLAFGTGKRLNPKQTAGAEETDKNDPVGFIDWVESKKELVYFDEFRRQWLLKSELFWNLHESCKDLEIADEIAWVGANNPVGGECENDLACMLSVINATIGKYIRLHPEGKFVPLAVGKIRDFMENIVETKAFGLEDTLDSDLRETIRDEVGLLRQALDGLMTYRWGDIEKARVEFARIFKNYLSK